MVEVTLKRDEPLEKALRRFKKKYEKAGILKDIKRNAYYLKPSEEKRIKRSKAMRRIRRNNMLAARRGSGARRGPVHSKPAATNSRDGDRSSSSRSSY